jgi:hypothetical protein
VSDRTRNELGGQSSTYGSLTPAQRHEVFKLVVDQNKDLDHAIRKVLADADKRRNSTRRR